jgi:hypothetical protein
LQGSESVNLIISTFSTVKVTAPKVLLHPTGEDIRPGAVQQVAKLAVGCRKEGGLHQTGFIFEGQKLHGMAVFGADDFAREEHTIAKSIKTVGPSARTTPAHSSK